MITEWCSTGTKTDPGAGAKLTGFVSGEPIASAHVNFLLNDLTVAAEAARAANVQRRLERALQLRTLSLVGETIDDTAESMAALQLGLVTVAAKVNTNGVFHIADGSDRFALLGALVSITSLVTDMAYDPTQARITVIGTGGNRKCYSDDGGTTWTAASTSLAGFGVRTRTVFDDDANLFLVGGPNQDKIYRSSGTTGGTASTSTLTGGVDGLAYLPGVGTLALRSTVQSLVKSTDGDTWSNSGLGFPNASSQDETGCLCGNGADLAFHVSRHNSGATLKISSSPTGVTWTTLATITAATAGLSSFSARPRILVCPTTGLLVVVCKANSSNLMVAYASLDGAEWSGPKTLVEGPDYDVDCFAIGGGRLFATSGAQLFASDGVGAD